MSVFLYQIGIFIAIQIASQFGKSSRNTAIILISIFTILQVYWSKLLLLQFIVIFISYKVSKRWFNNEVKTVDFSKEQADDSEYRNALNGIFKNLEDRKSGTYFRNGITLDTKFYYVAWSELHGPVSAKKIIRLVKKKRINRNCFVRQPHEEDYSMRAYEILEMFEN